MRVKHFISVFLMLFALGVGQLRADDPVTVFLETFGTAGNATPSYSSATCYTATTAMFTSGSGTSNYTGDGKVGKSTYSAANLSNGYTGASGNSGCYHGGSANTTNTIIQISNIKISGYSSLHLSFGALGGSGSHRINVYYKIDNGSKTTLINSGTITNSSWTLKEADIPGTGTNLTLYFEHRPTNNWTIRLDDIKVTGIASSPTPTCTNSITITKTDPTNGSNIKHRI